MIRGLELRINRNNKINISTLFNNIDITNKFLHIKNDDIIINNQYSLDIPHVLSGNEFLNIIDADKTEYMLSIFLDVKIYPTHTAKNDINTYEDFLNSDCEIIFLLYDVDYVEIYVKSEAHLLQFIKNADAIGCPSITIKTDLNDGRTRMSVW